ncbi:tetratricopeptide repeat protein [Oscillatoriales cyanobacterium LEGE 11467]|uniref:Tetratricopeptide repeat protein n=1 Tax=Zarconia navalis LEGE 11467 TaxID=1828826 RepID=A0A928VSL1_9CYAN|nr:tetratricopeptide repeat protein [Zarconia navalis]MBE9039619.1 tetratricopeptide repeat protein [Zarconia navalis LEGE 11467]
MKLANQQELIESLVSSGNKLKNEGQLSSAIQKYKEVLNISPEFVKVLRKLGETYIDNKDFDEAISVYRKLVSLKPNNAKLRLQLAELLDNQKNLNEAICEYQKLVQIKPKIFIKTYENLGKLLRKQGQISNVMLAYRNAIELKVSSNKEVYHFFGKIILQLSVEGSELDESVLFFKKAAKEQPDNPWHYYNLANVLFKQGKLNESIESFEKSLILYPQLHESYLQLCKVYTKQGEIDKVIQCCVKSLESKPNFVEIYKFLKVWSDKYSHQLSHEQVLQIKQVYQKAIDSIDSSKPAATRLYISLGNFLRKQGEFSESVLCFQKAMYRKVKKSNPEFTERHWNNSKYENPNFLVIGVMKCGTTSLYDYMIQHPHILPSVQKEPCCLSRLIHENRKTSPNVSLHLSESEKSWYLSHFPPVPEENVFITGEASTPYIYTSGVEELVFNSFPQVKLIIMLRDPVKRAISQYHHWVRTGWENRSIEEVFYSELEELELQENSQAFIKNAKCKSYIVHGLYFYFLRRWMSFFSKEQFLILKTEDLSKNASKVMNQVFDFLNLSEYPLIQYSKKNSGSYSKIDENLISKLYSFYESHNQKLEQLLNIKLDWNP